MAWDRRGGIEDPRGVSSGGGRATARDIDDKRLRWRIEAVTDFFHWKDINADPLMAFIDNFELQCYKAPKHAIG